MMPLVKSQVVRRNVTSQTKLPLERKVERGPAMLEQLFLADHWPNFSLTPELQPRAQSTYSTHRYGSRIVQ